MNLYDNIKEDILDKIKNGTYPIGETIPSELELAESYGVSRATVRQALQILAADGYVEKRRRRGTIVTKPKVEQSARYHERPQLRGRHALRRPPCPEQT